MSKKREYTGYAVVTEDFSAYSFSDFSLETCKRYLRKGYVIVQTYRETIGYRLELGIMKNFEPLFYSKYSNCVRFLWFTIKWEKVTCRYAWEKGKDKIVYRYEDLKKN